MMFGSDSTELSRVRKVCKIDRSELTEGNAIDHRVIIKVQ
jgi:hypothetical protein